MSESIYNNDDPSSINTPAVENNEGIYMNVVPKRSQEWTKLSNNQGSPRGHCHCLYKMAVVFLGLLCILLSAVIVGLYIKTKGTRQFQTEEKDQLEMQYNNLTEEKDQLQMQYNNLNEEKDQLQMQYNNLTEEKDQVEADRNRMIKDLETNNNNLRNEKSQLTAKFTTERDELQRRLCKLESHDMKIIKQHAVDVTLDPDTASPYLTLSADGKRATPGPWRDGVLKTSKRFWTNACVLGKEGFSSGKFYYEVVTTSENWYVGVVRESINRNDQITLSPKSGHWTEWEKKSTGKRVGIFVDYDAGLVSFYDADTWGPMRSYNNATFNERIYPFFCVSELASVTISAVGKCTSE